MPKGRVKGSRNFTTTSLREVHLFSDGHAAIIRELQVAGVSLRVAELVERFGPICKFAGTVVLKVENQEGKRGCASLVKKASQIEVNGGVLKITTPDFDLSLDQNFNNFSLLAKSQKWEDVEKSTQYEGLPIINKTEIEVG